MAVGAGNLLVCNLKGIFRDMLQSHKGLLKRLKQQRVPEAHPMTPTAVSFLKFFLKEQGKLLKAKCLASSIITKRTELLGSKHTQAILSLASVVSFLEKLRRYKGRKA